MWEDPTGMWRRLKLGREEYLQRLVTTLITGGDPPGWNSPVIPTQQGLTFLQRLHALAHGDNDLLGPPDDTAEFIDECMLPNLGDDRPNGWPDWVVRWRGRVWIVELKTEKGSHRPEQLPYYLRLAAAAYPETDVDLTYLTGPLDKPDPSLVERQRYAHITWAAVLPLVETVWSGTPEASTYVAMVREIVANLSSMAAQKQREAVLGALPEVEVDLLAMARLTAIDGEQRAVGAETATDLDALRDDARALIDALPVDDPVRNVMPWLWQATRTDGKAKTTQGAEFGYELRFSRYRTRQIGN